MVDPAVAVVGEVLVTKAVVAVVPVAVHVVASVVLALVNPSAVSVDATMVVHWALISGPFTREQEESMWAEFGRRGRGEQTTYPRWD